MLSIALPTVSVRSTTLFENSVCLSDAPCILQLDTDTLRKVVESRRPCKIAKNDRITAFEMTAERHEWKLAAVMG